MPSEVMDQRRLSYFSEELLFSTEVLEFPEIHLSCISGIFCWTFVLTALLLQSLNLFFCLSVEASWVLEAGVPA